MLKPLFGLYYQATCLLYQVKMFSIITCQNVYRIMSACLLSHANKLNKYNCNRGTSHLDFLLTGSLDLLHVRYQPDKYLTTNHRITLIRQFLL